MAVFTGKVIRTRFTNEKNDTIEIIFLHEGKEVPYFIAVDPTHVLFKALLDEGWDLERIQKDTIDFNRAQSRAFNEIVEVAVAEEKKELRKKFAKELNVKLAQASEATINKSGIFSAILENNEDEEAIFKLKLAIFETEGMKSLKDRTKKLNIRKGKTILEVLQAYNEVISEK